MRVWNLVGKQWRSLKSEGLSLHDIINTCWWDMVVLMQHASRHVCMAYSQKRWNAF